MTKYRANDLVQNGALELPVELELHFAGIFLKGNKVPPPRKMLEWAIHKDHIYCFRPVIDVSSMEVLINTLEVNIDFGIQNSLGLLKYFHPTAPGQELWVASNVSNQAIHAVG